MIELFQHLIHLDFKWIFENYGTSIYLILFLVIFMETGLVIMPFLPGDSLLFIAGMFAKSGQLEFAKLFGLLFVAAVLGDNVNYWLGRKVGLKFLHLKFRGKPLVKQAYIDQTQQFFEKHGTKAIIMARFVPIVRTFAPFVAGIAEMKYRRFVSFDLLGGLVWIGSLTIAGYFLGQFDIVKNNIEKVAILIVLISASPVILQLIKKRSAKKTGHA